MNPLLLSGLFDLGKGLIDRFFPDPAAKAAAQMELLKMQQATRRSLSFPALDAKKMLSRMACSACLAVCGYTYPARN